MTAEQVLNLQRAIPFQPFELLLADGRGLTAASADCMNLASDGRSLFLFLPPSDATEIIDLMLVVSLRFSEEGAASINRPET
jgi:hypothetical protein